MTATGDVWWWWSRCGVGEGWSRPREERERLLWEATVVSAVLWGMVWCGVVSGGGRRSEMDGGGKGEKGRVGLVGKEVRE